MPEGRGIFPNLTVRENLVMAARAGVDGRREWVFDRVMETFPRLSERCLLYTSDAADERSSVDLGGRRFINKKKKKKHSSVGLTTEMNKL